MHDPLVVAFCIPRPWPPRRRGRYRSPLVTVWHREPRGHDAFTVCRYDGWWKLHFWHWKLQIHALQESRRWLLTRCAWCGGPSRKGDPVNCARSWDGPRGRWWQGDPGLYHQDCSAIAAAHAACTCTDPVLDEGTYGLCARCGKRRAYGRTPGWVAHDRELAAIPAGRRCPSLLPSRAPR
jgi:hypothetical protein